MNSKNRMTFIDFTKRSELRNFLLRSSDDQKFFVDPQFFSIWSGAFRSFLENAGENRPEFYDAQISGSQLFIFLKLIHAQIIFEAKNPQEFEELLNAFDVLNAVQGLKEGGAFYSFYCFHSSPGFERNSTRVDWARVFLKSLVIFGTEIATNLLHNFREIIRLKHFQAAVDENMVEWLLSKGSNNVSKQILMHMNKAYLATNGKAVERNFQFCLKRLNESKFEAQKILNFDLELRLGEEKLNLLSNKSLLANQSSVFSSMFCGNFEDGQKRIVNLPEESTERHHNLLFDLLMPTFAGCFWRFNMWSIP